MKGHSNCAWIKVGETEICGKSRCVAYCKVHPAKIRKGRQIPVPVDLEKGEFRAVYSFAETVVEIRFGTDIVVTPERLTCGARRSFNKIQTIVIHKVDIFYLR